MKRIPTLFVAFLFSVAAHGSTPRASPADDTAPLFQPMISADLPLETLKEMAVNTSRELETYDALIGKARGDQLKDMLQASQIERRAGCILTWSGRTFSIVFAGVATLSSALGGPSWLIYVTSGVTVVSTVSMALGEYFTADATNMETKVVKRQADALKIYAQLTQLIADKEAAQKTGDENNQLKSVVRYIHQKLASNVPLTTGDVVITMQDDPTHKDKGEAGVQDAVAAPESSQRMGMVKRKKGANVTPHKVAPATMTQDVPPSSQGQGMEAVEFQPMNNNSGGVKKDE